MEDERRLPSCLFTDHWVLLIQIWPTVSQSLKIFQKIYIYVCTHTHMHHKCMHMHEFRYLQRQKKALVPLELELQTAVLRVLGILVLCKSSKHSWLPISKKKNKSPKVRQNSFSTHPSIELIGLLQESRETRRLKQEDLSHQRKHACNLSGHVGAAILYWSCYNI